MSVMYYVVFAALVRCIINAIESLSTKDWINFHIYHKNAFAAFIVLFALILEIAPVIIVLFSIKSTRGQFDRKNSINTTTSDAESVERPLLSFNPTLMSSNKTSKTSNPLTNTLSSGSSSGRAVLNTLGTRKNTGEQELDRLIKSKL